MPTLNIKDPEVYRLASELARRRGTSMTAVVRDALGEALEHTPDPSRAGIAEKLMEIGQRAAASMKREGFVPLTDDDLYDEEGLPK
jgi:antitoxin VapB